MSGVVGGLGGCAPAQLFRFRTHTNGPISGAGRSDLLREVAQHTRQGHSHIRRMCRAGDRHDAELLVWSGGWRFERAVDIGDLHAT